MLAVLRIRDFRLLWSSRLVSQLGTWLLTIAVPAYVLELTGSVMATGLTLAAEYLPLLLLGPFAGVLADRWDRRRLMYSTDLFRAVAVSLLLVVDSPGMVWLIYVALFTESAGSVLFRPAAQAHVPALIGTGSALSSANALNSITDGTVRLVGPPLGAALAAFVGIDFVIGADIASYLISALAIALSTRRPLGRDRTDAAISRYRTELHEGLTALRESRIARGLLLISTLFLTANASLSALLVPFGVTRLGGSEQTGFVVSALGVGFLLGGPLIRALLDRTQPRRLLAAGLAGVAAGFITLFSASSLTAAAPAAVAIGVFGSMALVVPQTALQRALPNAVLGRVSSVFFAAEALATLIGAVVGPSTAQAFGIRTVAAAACVVTLAAAALCATLPRVAVPATAAGTGPGPRNTEEEDDPLNPRP
ncbi:MFS transporter [Mangrovihabitans endophyticus]|uniref:MFS transporter n=1 Tax=Mangrovihabitans endophyticus TaxID=1751298 RepID=A0A8J3FLF4_9ACTN|nr:MFS transporter [Mangrovihabitans endophyticus]GGK72651.1 MFS transporter [Mangrovihabitans endophyticus]